MISKTFEWYRIVSATPSSQAVEARNKAVAELTSTIFAREPSTFAAIAEGVAREFDGSAAEAPIIAWLLRILKQHDPAVSESLSENQMELRVIAAITLGELLVNSPNNFRKSVIVAAADFVSAMNLRLLPKQRYLRSMLEDLCRLAVDVIENAADIRRKRTAPSVLSEAALAVPDQSSTKVAIAHLQTQIAQTNWNAALDREEIGLFWFIATGFSRTKKKAFADLPPSVAAVYAAIDLHHFLLFPAPLSSFEILTAIVENKRELEFLKPIPLGEHLRAWTADEWNKIADPDSSDASLSSQFPGAFPLTWAANRMRQGQCLPNWSEFSKLTRLSKDMSLKAAQLSRQLLYERIALSLAANLS